MHADNTLRAEVVCPSCHKKVETELKFQYGGAWDECYHIGEKIRWDEDSVGARNTKHVVVHAVAIACEECGFEDLGDFEIKIERDKIVSVEPLEPAFADVATDNYVVVEN